MMAINAVNNVSKLILNGKLNFRMMSSFALQKDKAYGNTFVGSNIIIVSVCIISEWNMGWSRVRKHILCDQPDDWICDWRSSRHGLQGHQHCCSGCQ